MIKKNIKSILYSLLKSISSTSFGKYIHRTLIDEAMSRTISVSHNGVKLLFSAPNTLNEYRANSFSKKEPETLEWIDGFQENSVFWDIGANVGLYTCYAVKKKECQVIAFEPSVFNLELLARNIFSNKMTNLVTIIPLPLTDRTEPNTLNMTTTEWGGALSSFGQDYGQDGKDISRVFEFRTYGFQIDSLANWIGLPLPMYLKMDVDGIEHLILSGGTKVLSNVKSILIEINDDFAEQSEKCSRLLIAAGLTLIEKRHSEELEKTAMKNSFNQIWSRI